MNNGLRHFTNQFVSVWRSWLVILVCSFAAGIFFMSVLMSNEPDFLDWGMFVVLLAQVGWGAALVGAGIVNSTTTDKPAVGLLPGAGLGARPNPTIPIDPVTRVGAEALAGLAVMLAFQVVSLVLAFALTGRDALQMMRISLLGDVAALPMAAAWLLPARSKFAYGLRSAAASLVGGAAVYMSVSMRSPVPVLLVSMGLAVVLFATSDAVARIEGRPRRQAASTPRTALARRWRAPLEQLWHDALVGPFRAERGVLYSAAGAGLAAFLTRFVANVPTLVRQVLVIWATFIPGLLLVMRPLGLASLGGGSTLRAGEHFLGSWFAGGVALPLRREWVARAFYLHGLVTGALAFGLLFLEGRLVGMPMVFDIGARSNDGRGWLPWLLMLPSLGGCLASSAVGRRELKWLSLAALSWTPVVYFIAVGFWPAAAGGPSKIWFAGAIGLVLAMVGGVPPLVYLFPRKAAAVRRLRQP